MSINVQVQGNMNAVAENFYDDGFSTVRIKEENGCGVTLFFNGEGAYEKASKIAAIINGEDV